MIKRNFFYCLGIVAIAGFMLVACSQDEDDLIQSTVVQEENNAYVYDMELNGGIPSFDDEGTTRAVSNTWANNATLYIRFRTGSSTYVEGTATYNSTTQKWTVSANSPLSSSSYTDCEVYYFTNPGSVTTSTVNMTESTACYSSTNATYKHASPTSISVEATLTPMTWRMRFKGTNGTTITMPSTDNNIQYYSAFDRSTGAFTKAEKNISLTVSSGYTPYIHGVFVYSSSSNKITVKNGSSLFTRQFSSANLPVGKSGYFDIPTTSSHSGWTPAPEVELSISVSNSGYFKPDGDYWALSITTGETQVWTATVNKTWAHFNSYTGPQTKSGTGPASNYNNSNSIVLYVNQNTGTSIRTANVTVTAGSTTKTCTIKQGYYTNYDDWTSTNKTDNSVVPKTYTLTGVNANDVLTFSYDVSSESYDKFKAELLKDGTVIATVVDGVGGTKTDTSSYTFTSSGTFTLKLMYQKDGNLSSGRDNVIVTNIKVEHKQ